ncbi:hypothetical protein SR908_15610 [Chromohalobacter canadensis]|uniref:Uncharacterized protein n=1 Tax=Chromohalobacter canadensis TaxID=141389 RepID=A0ABZ0Y9Y3_9GAMM|nr:hypothetical protein [Chromohalobacter canadensis]WQH08875.1 hypothetical protein SR908_15610 [Chromohalobacter canadensis]
MPMFMSLIVVMVSITDFNNGLGVDTRGRVTARRHACSDTAY